jgi:hypothetical protein
MRGGGTACRARAPVEAQVSTTDSGRYTNRCAAGNGHSFGQPRGASQLVTCATAPGDRDGAGDVHPHVVGQLRQPQQATSCRLLRGRDRGELVGQVYRPGKLGSPTS